MKEIKYCIVGQGHLSFALHEELRVVMGASSVRVFDPPLPLKDGEKAVVVFTGSARTLEGVIQDCCRGRNPLILASTGLDDLIPRKCPIVLVKVPNLRPEAMALMIMSRLMGKLAQHVGMKATVEESHPQRKSSPPATAIEFARCHGMKPDEVLSYRRPFIQQCRFAVPFEFLDAHAYNSVTYQNGNVEAGYYLKVHGRPYAEGVLRLTPIIQNLRPGVYEGADLLFKEVLEGSLG